MNRDQLRDRIRSICSNPSDLFTLDAWNTMTVEQLATVVALLPIGVRAIDEMRVPPPRNQRQGTCYLMENLVWYLRNQRNPVHPHTRQRITRRQVTLVYEAYKRVTGRNPNLGLQTRDSVTDVNSWTDPVTYIYLGGINFVTPPHIRVRMITTNALRTRYTFYDLLRPLSQTTTSDVETPLTRFVVPRHLRIIENPQHGGQYLIQRLPYPENVSLQDRQDLEALWALLQALWT